MTQMELRFPDDTDMSRVRQWMVDEGPETDNAVGLRFKAYLVRERGVRGSQVNEYAPFFVWEDLRGLAYLLWQSDGFSRVLEHFDRPRVQAWVGAGFEWGPASKRTPNFATRRIVQFAENSDPRAERQALLAQVRELATLDNVRSAMIGIDANSWSAVLFVLWVSEPEGDWDALYTVEHFSMPGVPYDI